MDTTTPQEVLDVISALNDSENERILKDCIAALKQQPRHEGAEDARDATRHKPLGDPVGHLFVGRGSATARAIRGSETRIKDGQYWLYLDPALASERSGT